MLSVIMVPALSQADGVGLSYTYGSGESTVRIDGLPNIDYAMKRTGYGIMYDTNVGRDHIFNYRLTIEQAVYDSNDDPYEAITLINDFGFSLFRDERMRFWMGPEITIALLNDTGSDASPNLFGFGMGIATGLNLNMSENFTLALKAAFISQTMSGRMSVSGSRYDVVTDDEFAYGGISLIYRFGERF